MTENEAVQVFYWLSYQVRLNIVTLSLSDRWFLAPCAACKSSRIASEFLASLPCPHFFWDYSQTIAPAFDGIAGHKYLCDRSD